MKQFNIAIEFQRSDKKYPESTYTDYHEVICEDRETLERLLKRETWLENFVFLDYVYELRDVRIDEMPYDPDATSTALRVSR